MLHGKVHWVTMEYASIMWDPHHSKDIQMLENTQKFALRTCCKDWSSQYTDLLDHTNFLPSLASRRKQAKLCHLFKIIHGLTDCQCAPVVRKGHYTTQDRSPTKHFKIYLPIHHSFCIHFTPIPYPYGIHCRLAIKCSLHCAPLSDRCRSILNYLYFPFIIYWVIMLCISSCYSC